MSDKLTSWIAGVFIFFLVTIPIYAYTVWTDRSLDYILTAIKGEAANCPYWLSLIVSLFAPLTLLMNIITELYRLVA